MPETYEVAANLAVPTDPADDLLHGAGEIPTFYDEPLRRVRYWIEADLIPVGRLGGRIVASKTVLRRHAKRLCDPEAA